ncbi:hypothetical protein, partial [Acinetobacter baumannii]|uniref:hypothetical protein n=1 Tax=Acinetobacter baumannii TaxID=470 RepID=UPI003B984B91
MSGLRSEHISNRLFFFMLVIILSLLFMAVPLIVSSYQEYLKTKQGEFKHEVRQFQKPYDNQQAEQISLM